MRSDLVERRRALEERLDRARALESFLKAKTDVLSEVTGVSIEQIDPDGSFRAALSAVVGAADRRDQFDVVLSLPSLPFAFRIQNLQGSVTAEVVVQRGGPYDPSPSAALSGPPIPPPAVSRDAEVTGAIGVTGATEEPSVASDLAALLWQNVDDVP